MLVFKLVLLVAKLSDFHAICVTWLKCLFYRQNGELKTQTPQSYAPYWFIKIKYGARILFVLVQLTQTTLITIR